MPKRCYVHKNFNADSRLVIQQANAIMGEYNIDMTLRQLYYQFVARDLLPNKQASYDRLGRIISEARLAGLVDWDAIVDRTRKANVPSHWDNPSQIISACASSYRIDKWEDQDYYLEVWVEKEALAGVIEQAVRPLDVASFACRGYVSQSAQWRAAMRIIRNASDNDRLPVIIHLGDHDPSGIDMSRDILDRIALFMEDHGHESAEVERIALNMDQVEQYNPPPNPAKITDSRADKYIAEFGMSSWELDALDPNTLTTLITDKVASYRDDRKYNDKVAQEKKERATLQRISDNYGPIQEFLDSEEL